MLRILSRISALSAALFLIPALAVAQVYPEETVTIEDQGMMGDLGIAVTAAGGITGFTTNLQDVTDVGPAWDARVIVGTNSFLGGEVNYRGASNQLNDNRLTDSSNIISSAVEGSLRFNALPTYAVTPFVTAGAGWQGFQVDRDVAGGLYRDDDALVFPFSGGVAYTVADSLLVDGRFTFRYIPQDDVIIRRDVTAEEVRANSWETTLRLGYVF